MTLNVNGSPMSLVNVNGTRMEVVNVNGTEVYRAQNGNVTMVYTGGASGTFSPGVEDINRHFVVVGVRFSGSGLGFPAVPSINGVTMTQITAGNSGVGDDGGISGIYTIKIPTGTADLSMSGGNFTYAAVYRVTGIISMATAVSAGTNNGNISGAAASSANGCFFGASVQNFGYSPSFPSPNSAGLIYTAPDIQGRTAASNVTTGPTQNVNLDGNQINSYALFAYNLF